MKLMFLVLLLTLSVNAYEPYLQNRRTAFRKVAAGGAASTVISFDGVDDLINVVAVDLSADNTYSFTAWIRTGGLTDTWEPILIEPSDSTGLYLRSSGIFQFYPAGTAYSTGGTLSANTWYHYAFVNNGGTWNAYLDGVSSANGTGAAVGPNNMTRIGTDGGDQFDGRVGEMAIFSVALSGTDVANLHAKTTTPTTLGNLVAYLKLDDVANGVSGSGATFVDSSGNGHTGTGDDGANNTGLTGVTADF